MTEKKLNFIFIPLALILFVLLIRQLWQLPEGLILPGLFVGMIWLVFILMGTLFVAFLVKRIYKKTSFLTILAIAGTFSFGFFFYSVYTPKLKIIVPEGYNGQVSLVLANVDENELFVDSNGIGYINPVTFGRLYMKPEVVDRAGNNLNSSCVGYDHSTFWSNSEQSSSRYSGKVAYHSFQIKQVGSSIKKRNSDPNLMDLVNWRKVRQPK